MKVVIVWMFCPKSLVFMATTSSILKQKSTFVFSSVRWQGCIKWTLTPCPLTILLFLDTLMFCFCLESSARKAMLLKGQKWLLIPGSVSTRDWQGLRSYHLERNALFFTSCPKTFYVISFPTSYCHLQERKGKEKDLWQELWNIFL